MGLETSIRKYTGSIRLLKFIYFFYYLNGRFRNEKELVRGGKYLIQLFVCMKCLEEKNRTALVCMQFLCTLNVYLGRVQETSKNSMNELYQNFSMQAFSKKNYAKILNFDKMTKLF